MGRLVLSFESEDKGGKVAGIKSEMYLLGGPKSEEHVAEDEETFKVIRKWRSW
jgi:hypothetical protein